MDNLPAHKLASIKPMIEAVGASILCLSPGGGDKEVYEIDCITVAARIPC
jgi:hypothetical protein